MKQQVSGHHWQLTYMTRAVKRFANITFIRSLAGVFGSRDCA